MSTSKRRRHTPEQIIRKLAEGNELIGAGKELDEVCRHLEIGRIDLAPVARLIGWHEGQRR